VFGDYVLCGEGKALAEYDACSLGKLLAGLNYLESQIKGTSLLAINPISGKAESGTVPYIIVPQKVMQGTSFMLCQG